MEPNLRSNDSNDNKDAGDLSVIRVCRKPKRQDYEVCDFFQPSSIGSVETTLVGFSDDLVFAWLRDCIAVGAEHSLTDDAAADAAMEAHDSNLWAWAYMPVAEVGTLRRR
ncbi:hypothetical protein H634G_05227 [Metarhizium anisopliae BRIP 53293]|uniref:Uncharacterized protein n=1 Tax=Metarhizium anisopliae BRIP 53293 TaxID=1291518 RepID=A0A0D9P490_METAN|nr:hypothetical protein H634G_05227 [Metarhizium anisopliae BRIP 53293]KJK90430.1 hypothetical protein H633G_05679 [Metarhizium anisopliae BRIP 53284]